MSTRGAAAVIAGLLVVIGLVVGFVPHSAIDPDLGVSVPCGSAFSPKAVFLVCGNVLSGPRWTAVGIAAVGALAGLFLMLTAKPAAKQSEDEQATTSQP